MDALARTAAQESTAQALGQVRRDRLTHGVCGEPRLADGAPGSELSRGTGVVRNGSQRAAVERFRQLEEQIAAGTIQGHSHEDVRPDAGFGQVSALPRKPRM
jgi:hypothetical protein